MFVFEIGKGFQYKPGLFVGEINGKKSYRFWWSWFAVSFMAISLKEYTEQASAQIITWSK